MTPFPWKHFDFVEYQGIFPILFEALDFDEVFFFINYIFSIV